MGKVLEKLQNHVAVKSLVEGKNGIVIVLADGYAQPDGSVETVVQTAHAARLWIKEASNGRDAPRKSKRTSTIVDAVTGEETIVPEVELYPGLPKEDCKPIWEHPKNWNPNEAEGRDAFRRGYAKNSHGRGDLTTAGKEFEQAWEQERKLAEQRAAEAAIEAIPDEPSGCDGEVAMCLSELDEAA